LSGEKARWKTVSRLGVRGKVRAWGPGEGPGNPEHGI